MLKRSKTKIYISGHGLGGKYLLIFSDGKLIDRLLIKRKRFIIKYFCQSVDLEYVISNLSRIVLAKLVMTKLVNAFRNTRSGFLEKFFIGFVVSSLASKADGVLSFSLEGDVLKPWISRACINQGVKAESLNHSIEYDFLRFSFKFSLFIWGIERPNLLSASKELIGVDSRLKVWPVSITKEVMIGSLTFHKVGEGKILHAKTPIVAGAVFPTDFYNFCDSSWPSDSPVRFKSRLVLMANSSREIQVDQSAIFFGSSTSWFHFLIEILPRFLHFGHSEIQNLSPVIEHDTPHQILDVLRMLTSTEVIKIHPSESMNFSDITFCIDARYPNGLDLPNRKQDVLLVRNFFVKKLKLDGDLKRTKLFIVRNSSLFRYSPKYTELSDYFASKGFAIIDSGNLSMAEQVELFSRASVVVGETGSSLTNLLFCPDDCQVIEISLNSFMPNLFADLCRNLDLEHVAVKKIRLRKGVIEMFASKKESNLTALIESF